MNHLYDAYKPHSCGNVSQVALNAEPVFSKVQVAILQSVLRGWDYQTAPSA